MDSSDTRQQTGFRLDRRDWASIFGVALLCTAGAGASAWLYLEELNSGGQRGLGSPLAQVERSELKVRRKPGNSFVWSYVQDREQLYRKDSVQTSAGSAAAIQFNDGSRLELGENSLIVIDDISNLALNFKQGTVVIKDKDGNDTQISVDREGKQKVQKLSVRLSQPEAYSERWVSQNGLTPVRFAWQNRGGSPEPGAYRLEVSTDRSFRPGLTQSIDLPDFARTQTFSANLAPGNYHWRISRDGQPLTAVGHFKLLPAIPLKPTYPAANQNITVWNDLTPVQFRWLDPLAEIIGGSQGKSVEHWIEVANDPAFKVIIASERVPTGTNQFQLKIPQGRFYWRLSSKLGEQKTASMAQPFALAAGKRFEVKLTLPQDRASQEAAQQLRLTWNTDTPGADALEYEWQVRDAQRTIVASGKTTGNTALWQSPSPGLYQWHVLASNSKGDVLGESNWRTLTVYQGRPLALSAPLNGQKILYWNEPTEFEFRWEADSTIGDGSYELELSDSDSFATQLATRDTREARVSSKDLKLAPGTYFWRLRIKDKSGNVLKTSSARTFTYGLVPKLAPPVATAPASQQEFDLLEKDFEATFTWAPVPEATQYDLTIYRIEKTRSPASGTNRKVAHQSVTSETRALIKDLPPGDYEWTLRSFDEKKRPGEPMPPRSFKIIEGALLGAPEDVSVEVE